MRKPKLIHFFSCLATLCLLTYCAPKVTTTTTGTGGSSQGGAGTGGVTSGGGTSNTGGTSNPTSSGGTSNTGGTKASGGTTSAGGSSTGGSTTTTSSGGTTNTTPSGGTKASGGSSTGGSSTGGSSTGGSSTGGSSTGGSSTGGTKASGGSTSAGGSTNTGGTSNAGGTTNTGGTTSTGGTTAPTTDQGGVALAKPGDKQSTSKKYLNLGDMRILVNRWGSDKLGCSGTTMNVFVNSDKTFGYDFNRPACGGAKADPDYPEIEFGVAPFGAGSSDLTSPAFSTTALLPIQLSALTSASVTFDSFNSTYQKPGYYDTNFEFWISQQNPLTSSSPGVYAEIIIFFGWDGVRMQQTVGWPCDKSGTVSAGSNSYVLCHQKDGWGSGWRFFNFNLTNGPQNSINGKADVKAILDWVMKTYSGFSTSMWLTRIEVGTEVDDDTQGSATLKNLTFEINGVSKSPTFGQ